MLPYVKEFFDDRAQYCASESMRYYRECMKKFQEYTDELRPKIYNEYVLWLRSQPSLSNTSVRTYARGIKVYLNWLVSEEYIDIKLIGQARLPRNDNRMIQPLSVKEVEMVDAAISCERDYLIVHLMLDCGLRRGEVRGLQWANIDLVQGLLRIEVTKSSRPRVVPMPPTLVARIKAYRKTTVGDKPFDLSINAMKMLFKKLKTRSEIARVRGHLLRHTFGTSFMYYKMGDLYRLQLLMGHNDISTTCKYLHLARLYDIENMDIYKIDEVFRKK